MDIKLFGPPPLLSSSAGKGEVVVSAGLGLRLSVQMLHEMCRSCDLQRFSVGVGVKKTAEKTSDNDAVFFFPVCGVILLD